MPAARPIPLALDPADLGERWRRARRAALAPLVPAGTDLDDEAGAVAAAGPARRGELLGALFRFSWRLGRGAAARFAPLLGVEATARLLAGLASSCFCLAGEWRVEAGTRRLVRAGCRGNPAGERAVCDACREAIDGLVSGIGGGVRFTRLASRGRGGARCEDLLHPAAEPALAWGEIPAELAPALAATAAGLAACRVPVRFLGVAENRVAYAVEPGGIPACGGRAGLVQALIENHLRARLPGLEPEAAAARAVY